jgi:malonyl-CoA/methylmalonyl-CoA synthetase
MTLLDLFDAALAERADHPALNDVTYRQLDLGVRRVARQLRSQGIGAGTRFGIYCENRIGFVYAYLAALRLGAIVVPANVLYRKSDLAHVLEDADVTLLLVSDQTHPHAAELEPVRPMVNASEIEAWALDATLEPIVRPPYPADDDGAVIIYTSGTTGRSKGAVLSHGNLATIATQLTTAWRWTASDTLAIALPLFHIHGLGAGLNGTLASGGRLILHERFDATKMLETLRRPDVTMFFGVPTMYVRLLESLGDGTAPSLRLCVSGSAALSPEIHARFEERFGMTILERYGATEFGFATTNRFGGPRIGGSVGIPFPGVRIRINEPDDAGVGEILVNGPNVFIHYWGNPEATAAAFVVDADGTRWYKSGDLGSYDPELQVYRISGRIKELIISGGFNIYPLEVEIEIERFPGVKACAVVGVIDAARGELPVAFVEVEPGFERDALTAYLRDRLASFKIPKHIEIVDALPRNAMGKLEKPKLKTFALTP